MKSYFAYIRVSTQKQGQGVSLQEQRAAIERYAEHRSLNIKDWFEERETAAKRGRPIFGQMLRKLRKGVADGVIIHKIDRSARNLKDWADLGELIDGGYDVHFATESLDLNSRGGRLSADIQAVVAADYIRNLREETRKGFYGRLRQGLYPMRAPIGYLDCGGGKPKVPDPVLAPLVREAFELYATGRYSLLTLKDEVTKRGLRNHAGKPLTLNGIATLLHNPFYAGIMRIDRTNETFVGVHTPIISPTLFKRVESIIDGRYAPKTQKHFFLFRRMFTCGFCEYSLTGELQKGHTYYSCHTRDCPTTGVREEYVEQHIVDRFERATLTKLEASAVEEQILSITASRTENIESLRAGLELQQTQLKARSDRLIDAYMDHVIDKEAYEARRATLMFDDAQLKERIATLSDPAFSYRNAVMEIFELAKSLHSSYISGNPDEKREMVERVTSNRLVRQKEVEFALNSPFAELAERPKTTYGDPQRDDVRTLVQIIARTASSWNGVQIKKLNERC
jgi:DNA invertase Pin-like site-specific DNA recombinase